MEYLSRLLDSIATQQYRNLEVIVTDDSPDDSVQRTVQTFEQAAQDIPVVYYKNNPALGMPGNWNLGLSHCRGEWLKIMHDDDWLASENSLQVFHDTAQRSDKKFIFAAYNTVLEHSQKTQTILSDKIARQQLIREPMTILAKNIIGPPSVTLVHHSVKEQYDERLQWRVDVDYYIRILRREKEFEYIPECLVNVGMGDKQVTQAVKYNKAIEIPEAHVLLEKYGTTSLRNIIVYDSWWRFFRNLGIRTEQDLKKYPDKKWPNEILAILRFQQKIPAKFLTIGPLSKAFMFLSFTLNKA